MDKYEQRALRIMERGDALLAERKRRRALIRRTAALSLGTAAVLVTGIATQVMKPPKKPAAPQSSIITGTETSSGSQTAAAATQTTAAETVAETAPQISAPATVSAAPSLSTSAQTTAAVRTTAPARRSTTSATRTTAPAGTSTTSAMRTTAPARTSTSETTSSPDVPARTTTPVTTTVADSTTGIIEECTTTRPESAPELSYDEMIAENFRVLTLSGGDSYVMQNIEASPEYIGQITEEITLSPQKHTELLPKEITAHIYQIGSISPDLFTVVRFDGSGKLYTYYNSDYSPSSLGALIDDIDLFGSVYFRYVYYAPKKYYVEQSRIRELLFSDRNAPLTNTSGSEDIQLIADIPALSYSRISFYVQGKGYLWCSLLPRNERFFIGSENAYAFIDHVDLECQTID